MVWFWRKKKRPMLPASLDAPLPDEPRTADPLPEPPPLLPEKDAPMSSEGLHVSRDRLSRATIHKHYAITSLMEELEAVDWYRQRAEDTEDAELKRILLHNAREEIEHACMVLEWLRQNDEDFADQMKKYLFKDGSVMATEAAVMGRGEETPHA
jgi:hypothetical protein